MPRRSALGHKRTLGLAFRVAWCRLGEPSVQAVYRRSYHACRMDGERLPGPREIQELVQAWKQLWKWRR